MTPRLRLAVEAGAKCAGVDGIDGDHHALVDHRVERVGADLFGGEEGEGGEEGCTAVEADEEKRGKVLRCMLIQQCYTGPRNLGSDHLFASGSNICS